MNSLTPVQLLIWIVGVELVSVPILSFLASWVISQYFKAKDISFARRLEGLGRMLREIGGDKEDNK